MKQFGLILGVLVSTSAMALPAPFNHIAAELSTQRDFQDILKAGSFDSVLLKSVPRNTAGVRGCGTALMSKSGTLVEVTLENSWKHTSAKHYFVTSETARDLTLCK
jgi:hypothetical protein